MSLLSFGGDWKVVPVNVGEKVTVHLAHYPMNSTHTYTPGTIVERYESGWFRVRLGETFPDVHQDQILSPGFVGPLWTVPREP